MELIEFMFAPFVACVTLIGIHGYFGIHVLKREIIFIDIAMAQIAAFGITLAVVFNIDIESNWSYVFSVAFTTAAAAIFALIKNEKLKIPLEAIIGLSYAIATTGAVILIDKSAGSEEHIKEMLVGSILWVTWPDIFKSLFAYSIIGTIHYIFRDKFIAISDNYKNASKSGINVKFWDFVFYGTLGLTVMHSVRIGGILVVFAFLVIPASISMLFSDKWSFRIIIAWLLGTLGSALGLLLSWFYDVPSGPAVIIFLGLFLIIAIISKKLKWI